MLPVGEEPVTVAVQRELKVTTKVEGEQLMEVVVDDNTAGAVMVLACNVTLAVCDTALPTSAAPVCSAMPA
jgi:hypothetical protein